MNGTAASFSKTVDDIEEYLLSVHRKTGLEKGLFQSCRENFVLVFFAKSDFFCCTEAVTALGHQVSLF